MNLISDEKRLTRLLERTIKVIILLIGCLVGSCIVHFGIALDVIGIHSEEWEVNSYMPSFTNYESIWRAPDTASIPSTEAGDLIRYGRELIEHTSAYLGPNGKVAHVSNGMNCQNCHLSGGTKPFGNNYGAVANKYPAFRNRSGEVEGFEKRVNDCFQRSLNGVGLDESSLEMKAIVSYIKWVGKDVPKGESPKGFGLVTLPNLDRAADPVKGKEAYGVFCSRCHGVIGEGLTASNGLEWKYPPLWGSNSYNKGAGLYRISKFAAFIKANMPYGITFENILLTDEESWDIAAYVNSLERPEKDFSNDWPDISKKPMDHPFGPYSDKFTEDEHKYGPYGPILAAKKNRKDI